MATVDASGRAGKNRAALAIAAGLVATSLVVRYLSPLVVTLAAGAALYYLFAPVCARLAGRRVPRLVTVVGIALFLCGLAVVLFVLVVPRVYAELQDLVAGLPAHLAALEQQLAARGLLGEGADPHVRRAVDALVDRAGALVSGGLRGAFGFAAASLGSVSAVLLGVFLGFYLLLAAGEIAPALAGWFPPEHRERWVRFGRESSRAIGGYVRSRVLAALFIMLCYLAAFLVLGVSDALLLAVVGGLFDLVPVIGPILAAIPALVVAAFHGAGQVIAVAVVMLVAQQIESAVLDPLIAGRMVHLPAAVMVIAVAVGSAVAGIPGMLVAVPLVAVARSALEIFYRERWEAPAP
jgi:predicted PurR-regulated permease PerM